MSVAPRSFLGYERYRHLKLALAGTAVCIAAYALCDPPGGRGGDSWVGYALGGIATALILWLMWFGVRKRSYGASRAPLRGWLSAHVYLGATLLILVPLHAGFQFGWNVHTTAFALMALVVVSGMFGLFFYASLPAEVTRNRRGKTLTGLLDQIAEIDHQCRDAARGLPDEIAGIVLTSIDETPIGGGLIGQFRVHPPKCGTHRAREVLDRVGFRAGGRDLADEAQVTRLVELLALKSTLLVRARRDIRLKALLDLWLLVHVPLSFATVAAVSVHVFVVFYYW